tara:strand:- start:77 stop:1315 length:1239 start_codon:yes stop_codon:yes gene_type:complete
VKKFDIQYIDPKALIPYFRNTKEHTSDQVEMLKKSITTYSFDQPIVVDEEMVIIKGHGRRQAAISLDMESVPVIVRDDLTDAQVRASRIADNKIAASTDLLIEELSVEIQELKLDEDYEFEAELIGFGDEELQLFEDQIESDAQQAENDAGSDTLPQALQSDTNIQKGDVYQLGNHVLICGDCTDGNIYDDLLAGETVDQLVTDPPYGINYVKSKDYLEEFGKAAISAKTDVQNDDIKDYRAFFTEFLSIIPFSDYNTIYCFLMGSEIHNLRLAFDDCKITWADYLVWQKNHFVLSRKDYKAKHEWVAYGWKGKHKWHGPNNRTTMLEYSKELKNTLHPTMKPIPLLEQLVTDGSPPNGIVLDCFGGSGSTMIACENMGRKCRMIELSPQYCDVIIKRWETHTGKEAELLKS